MFIFDFFSYREHYFNTKLVGNVRSVSAQPTRERTIIAFHTKQQSADHCVIRTHARFFLFASLFIGADDNERAARARVHTRCSNLAWITHENEMTFFSRLTACKKLLLCCTDRSTRHVGLTVGLAQTQHRTASYMRASSYTNVHHP